MENGKCEIKTHMNGTWNMENKNIYKWKMENGK